MRRGRCGVWVELSPRRRDLAWARVLLAWAKSSNLGASWARMRPELGSLYAWMFSWYLYELLYDDLMGMFMHDWERVLCVNHEFDIIFIWIILERLNICIYMVTSLTWAQWTWWFGNPVAWLWYEEKHFTHGWEWRVGIDSTYDK